MKYYTSDLHLSHKNIIKYENRPFANVSEMNFTIMQNWNKKVRKDDEVYVLGDFAFCRGEEANGFLQKLNGKKYLIKGNHDRYLLKDKTFDKHLFCWIDDYARVDDKGRSVILFHYPIAEWDLKYHGSYHCYGHIHSNKSQLIQDLDLEGFAFNVGVDVRGFEPKTLDELIEGL